MAALSRPKAHGTATAKEALNTGLNLKTTQDAKKY